MNITRERVRQIEAKTLKRKDIRKALREHSDAPDGAPRQSMGTADSAALRSAQADVPDLVADDDDDGDANAPTKLSFFAPSARTEKFAEMSEDDIIRAWRDDETWREADRADKAASDRAFRTYMRSSAEHGFAKRTGSHGTLTPELAAIQPKTEAALERRREVPTMKSNEEDLPDRMKRILVAYRELVKETGFAPMLLEIAERAEIKGTSNNAKQANVSAAMKSLRALGLIEEAPKRTDKANGLAKRKPKPEPMETPATTAEAVRTRPRARANGHAPHPPKSTPNLGSSDDELVAQLVARRDFHADKVAALEIAIQALGGATPTTAFAEEKTTSRRRAS